MPIRGRRLGKSGIAQRDCCPRRRHSPVQELLPRGRSRPSTSTFRSVVEKAAQATACDAGVVRPRRGADAAARRIAPFLDRRRGVLPNHAGVDRRADHPFRPAAVRRPPLSTTWPIAPFRAPRPPGQRAGFRAEFRKGQPDTHEETTHHTARSLAIFGIPIVWFAAPSPAEADRRVCWDRRRPRNLGFRLCGVRHRDRSDGRRKGLWEIWLAGTTIAAFTIMMIGLLSGLAITLLQLNGPLMR